MTYFIISSDKEQNVMSHFYNHPLKCIKPSKRELSELSNHLMSKIIISHLLTTENALFSVWKLSCLLRSATSE